MVDGRRLRSLARVPQGVKVTEIHHRTTAMKRRRTASRCRDRLIGYLDQYDPVRYRELGSTYIRLAMEAVIGVHRSAPMRAYGHAESWFKKPGTNSGTRGRRLLPRNYRPLGRDTGPRSWCSAGSAGRFPSTAARSGDPQPTCAQEVRLSAAPAASTDARSSVGLDRRHAHEARGFEDGQAATWVATWDISSCCTWPVG